MARPEQDADLVARLQSRLTELYRQSGYEWVAPLSVTSSESRTTFFVGSTSTVLLPKAFGRQPVDRRIFTVQPCLRTHALRDFANLGPDERLTSQSFFRMIGSIEPGPVTRDLLRAVREIYCVAGELDAHSLHFVCPAARPHLIDCVLAVFPESIVRATRRDRFIGFRYGVPELTGVGITIFRQVGPLRYRQVGDVIEIAHAGSGATWTETGSGVGQIVLARRHELASMDIAGLGWLEAAPAAMPVRDADIFRDAAIAVFEIARAASDGDHPSDDLYEDGPRGALLRKYARFAIAHGARLPQADSPARLVDLAAGYFERVPPLGPSRPALGALSGLEALFRRQSGLMVSNLRRFQELVARRPGLSEAEARKIAMDRFGLLPGAVDKTLASRGTPPDRRRTAMEVDVIHWSSDDCAEGALFSDAFWDLICRDYWERKPVVIKGAVPPGAITLAQLFRGALSCGRRRRLGDRFLPLHILVDHAEQIANWVDLSPGDADATFPDYVERLQAAFPGRHVGVMLQHYQRYDARWYELVRRALVGLYSRVGISRAGADTTVFAGANRFTASGIHKDTAGAFALVIEGRKKLLVWPDSQFPQDPHFTPSLHEQYARQAVSLVGEPGDVLYWPSSYWHLAEGNGHLCVTLNIQVYLETSSPFFPSGPIALRDVCFDALTELIRSMRWQDFRAQQPFEPQASEVVLAGDHLAALDRLERSVIEGDLRLRLSRRWLSHLTGMGLRAPDAGPPAELQAMTKVRIPHPALPLRHERVGDRTLVVSGAGHSMVALANPRLLQLLAELNRGEALEVAELSRRYSGRARDGALAFEMTADDVARLLAQLTSWGAIEEVEEGAKQC